MKNESMGKTEDAFRLLLKCSIQHSAHILTIQQSLSGHTCVPCLQIKRQNLTRTPDPLWSPRSHCHRHSSRITAILTCVSFACF